MAKKASNRSVKNICKECGETFYSAQIADFCTHKSTCRVKHHQRKAQAAKVAKTFMMDMDGYRLYIAFVERYPDLKEKCDILIFELGAKHATMALNLMWDALYKETSVNPS